MAASLRERKKQETHATILRTAKQLFVDKGYDETGMDEIAAAAQVSRTTLFNYFPSKSALVVAMVERREQAFQRFVEESCKQASSTRARIEDLFRRWAEYLLDAARFHALITSALTAGARSEVGNSAALGGYVEAFRTLVQTGVDQGDVRTDYSVEAMAQMLVSALLTGSYVLFQGRNIDLEQHFIETARFMSEAISIEKQR